VPEIKRPDGKESSRKEKSRIDSFFEGHIQAALPDADNHIVSAFHMLGVYSSNGMGQVPVSWSDVHGFCQSSTYDLEGWQAETLIDMSRIYCSWIHKGKDANCFSPWDDTSDEARVRHSKGMRDNAGKAFERMQKELNAPL